MHSIAEKKTDGEKKNKHITFSLDSDWSQKKSPKQLSLLPDKIVDSKRYLERNGRTMTPINLWIHLSMIGQTARFSSAAMEFTLFRTERQQEPYFPWMAARYLASNSIPNSSPFIILRILRERVTRSFRFLACWKKKEREKEKKRKSITIRWNSSNCPRRESSFAQRCAMKPYSPLRGVLPLWMPIRERDRANADNNVLLVHRIISGRERGKKEKKKRRKKRVG